MRALISARAQAIEAGNAQALAATSGGAQTRRDGREARRAGALALRHVTASPSRLVITGASARATVHWLYRLAGVRGRFSAESRIRLERGPAGWRVSRILASRRARPPWQVARFVLRRAGGFAVLAPAGLATPGLDAALHAARRQISATLPIAAPRPGLLVTVCATAQQARELTSRIQGVESLAAISDASVRFVGPARRVVAVAAQRIVLVWPALAALDPTGRRRVIAHELTHAALAARTSGRTSAWLVEGLALYASGDDRAPMTGRLLRGDELAGTSPAAADRARRTASLAALARPDSIARLSGIRQAAAYAYASAAAFAIAERHGPRSLLRLLDAFDDDRLRAPVGIRLEDAAIHRALHTSLRRLQASVRAYALRRLLAP